MFCPCCFFQRKYVLLFQLIVAFVIPIIQGNISHVQGNHQKSETVLVRLVLTTAVNSACFPVIVMTNESLNEAL